MTRHDRYLFRLWLARWGFALMVGAAILFGSAAAACAKPPVNIPSIALQAAPVYRVEVGAAVFSMLYVAGMAFALALRNRGFTEIGSGGVRAQDLETVSAGALSEEAPMEVLMDLTEEIDRLRVQLEGRERVN
jgi:hypothetical protein